MSIEPFKRSFPGKLRFWAIHCTINAIPSYLIAVVWLGLWSFARAQFAMLAAVVTFIIGYSVLTCVVPLLREGRNLFTRALKVGLVIRTVISVLTMLVVPLGPWLIGVEKLIEKIHLACLQQVFDASWASPVCVGSNEIKTGLRDRKNALYGQLNLALWLPVQKNFHGHYP